MWPCLFCGEKEMYEKISFVEIGGNKLPIRCDINILAVIQEEFETLVEFEQKVIGMKPVMVDGKPKVKEDGTIDYRISEPNIHAIAYALPLFITEGIAQAQEQGEDYSDIEWREALKDADFNYLEVALALYTEFERCFKRKKKQMNTKNPAQKRTTKKSTS